ncbi:MAG: PEP-CTERM sorting domain-containing protein [Pirellulales bacterium]|nr:PEP-CTERM sorting domain-containing protein [Pirellulales bacterium]
MRMTHVGLQMISVSSLLVLWAGTTAFADPLSIRDIQYVDLAADPAGNSLYNEQVVDCTGGIVTHILSKSQPRLFVQDPNYLDGWGAIQIKGWNGEDTFAGIQVGDWISVANVCVEEYRGTTFLQFGGGDTGPAPEATFTVVSTGNPVPDPKVVTLDQIAAPIEGPPGEWYVTGHSAEPFESMCLRVENVLVDALDLGKNSDNYNLHNEPWDADVWVSDYLNVDKNYFDLYHPLVLIGNSFNSVTGVLEQYTKKSSGWDYYQLLTTKTDDFVVVPEPATGIMLFLCLGWIMTRYQRDTAG